MQPTKRNIVDGVEHMGSFFQAMPEIAKFIEADYDPSELEKAYQEAMNLSEPNDDAPIDEEHDGYGIWWTNWTLKGKELNFTICFEKYEGYFGWAIRCPDEATYHKVKDFMRAHLRVD